MIGANMADAKHTQDREDRAWGALVLAWVLAVFAAIGGWFASMFRQMLRNDD